MTISTEQINVDQLWRAGFRTLDGVLVEDAFQDTVALSSARRRRLSSPFTRSLTEVRGERLALQHRGEVKWGEVCNVYAVLAVTIPMTGDRVTISLTDDAQSALEQLTERTDGNRSEVIREAISFYAANFESAHANNSGDLQTYYQMLSTGEHVLLDVDLLHAFLDTVEGEDGPDPEFLETVDQVAGYHMQEYAQRFDSLGELLEWLSFCGFLTVRETEGDTYQVVFPSESVRWFMMRFLQGSIGELPFAVEVEESISKVFLKECEQ